MTFIRRTINDMITGRPFEMGIRNTYSSLHGYIHQDPNFIYDRQTTKIMSRILDRDSNCLDVGANEGAFTKQMLRFAPQGRHMAFEPIPELAAKVAERYPQVEMYECALSNANGRSTFQIVMNNMGYSGLRRRSYDFGEPIIREIVVRTRTLDEIYPIERPLQFVKIDIEGAEYLMLQGGRRTLRRHKPYIVFEHGLGAANHYGIRPEHVYDLLVGEIGLSISTMEDWLRGSGPLSRDDFMEQFNDKINYYFLAHP